ncbi:hypothetical protein [Sphaerotilus hippei]|uniref:hypothetical protein n=1 Tax=Sphaerotilus hippei TaxID=744406 RepID=UPI0011B75C0A|nr:hypothetical protein [Sphaerotilus hippei]
MQNEQHRTLALQALNAYETRSLPVETISLCDNSIDHFKASFKGGLVYVLRLAPFAIEKHSSIAAIPNANDPLRILYIGGHSSGRDNGRYKKLFHACKNAEEIYRKFGFAKNDTKHGHPVANKLTTSLLQLGFSIKDCLLDILDGSGKYDELEFLIGYEEKFHHLPPWNTKRDGALAFVPNQK